MPSGAASAHFGDATRPIAVTPTAATAALISTSVSISRRTVRDTSIAGIAGFTVPIRREVCHARGSLNRQVRWKARGSRPNEQYYKAYINYMIFTGIFDTPNYRQPMRYFFHIVDGPKVYPDEGGSSLPGSQVAVRQAKTLALELRKAGALCRSNLVLVLDETGSIIFNCCVRATSHAPG